MDALRYSKTMRLNQLPAVIELPGYLNDAIRELTTKGLQQGPVAVEVNSLICHDGERFYLDQMAMGDHTRSTTTHVGSNRVGMYHSHPEGSAIDMADFREMLKPERRIENFSLVDMAGERRTALFKTMESPTMMTADIIKAQNIFRQSITEIARCAFMGYYEGRGTILHRVYPN